MKPRKYESPADFKQAVEQRLRSGSQSGTDFARRRQLLVFDLFLARVAQVMGDAATLKGGLVLELRLEHARTTKDIDLRLMGSPDDILEKLQNAARLNRVTFWASSLRNPGTRSIEDWQRKIPWNGRRSNAVLAEAISLMVKATIYSAQWAAAGRKRALTKLAAMTDLEKEREILLLRETGPGRWLWGKVVSLGKHSRK